MLKNFKENRSFIVEKSNRDIRLRVSDLMWRNIDSILECLECAFLLHKSIQKQEFYLSDFTTHFKYTIYKLRAIGTANPFAEKLVNDLEEKCNPIISSEIHQISCLLDPRYKQNIPLWEHNKLFIFLQSLFDQYEK